MKGFLIGKKIGKRDTPEQVIRILDELKNGKTVDELCRTHGVAQSTLCRWKSQYGEIDRDELSRLRELEGENGRLKRIVAQQVLAIDTRKDLLSKMVSPHAERQAVRRPSDVSTPCLPGG